jgi:uncharacterized protein (DUF302 family)
MAINVLKVQRFSVVSRKAFGDVVAAFERLVGHPDMGIFRKNMSETKTFAELEKVVDRAVGSSGLMEFGRFDLGEVVRKKNGTLQSVRFLVGNPVIMCAMVQHVPDAGSYAPVTILIDERPDGVHLSYDRMASFLARYENAEALKVARSLDTKVESALMQAAGQHSEQKAS